ncbi:MAG: hypothetical protein Q7S21_03415 [archaeon]|nr:hypothetical protein [archaeon]
MAKKPKSFRANSKNNKPNSSRKYPFDPTWPMEEKTLTQSTETKANGINSDIARLLEKSKPQITGIEFQSLVETYKLKPRVITRVVEILKKKFPDLPVASALRIATEMAIRSKMRRQPMLTGEQYEIIIRENGLNAKAIARYATRLKTNFPKFSATEIMHFSLLIALRSKERKRKN